MNSVAINAMIVQHGQPSGVGHYIVQLAAGFAHLIRREESGERLLVYCRPDAAHHFDYIEGIEVHPVPSGMGRIGRVWAEHVKLPHALKKDRVDALLNPAFTGPTRGASRIVTTVHDPYFLVIPEALPPAQRLFLKAAVPFCCRRSKAVITMAVATKTKLEQRYPKLAQKIAVIPLANRLPAPDSLPTSVASNRRFVLMVAAMTGNKNPGPLIEAIARLRPRFPELTFVHVGKDTAGRLKAAVESADAGDWSLSMRDVSDAELSALYEECLCVAVPSLCEGFGLPVLEAQAFGAPVISSNRGALPEVGGDGALYFDPLSVEQISATIAKLLMSEADRQALRHAGFANQRRFSWERTAAATLDILRGNKPR